MPLKHNNSIIIDGRYNGLNIIEGKLNGNIVFRKNPTLYYFTFTITLTDNLTWSFPPIIYAGNLIIDWGDGIITTNELSHTYASLGTFTINIQCNTSKSFVFSIVLDNNLSWSLPQCIYEGDLAFQWGDGAFTINEISHTYDTYGTYEVTLTHYISGMTSADYNALPSSVYNFSITITLSGGLLYEIPSISCESTLYIDWGDGSNTAVSASHTYSFAGTYIIKMRGNISFIDLHRANIYDSVVISINTPFPYSMRNQIYFQNTFEGLEGLTSIRSDLFKNCISARYVSATFKSCIGITSIPVGLFSNCPNIIDLGYCFCDTGITSIPSTLFSNLSSLVYVHYCFGTCLSLTSIPDLFIGLNNIESFAGTFEFCQATTGSAPTLWLRYLNLPRYQTNRCFLNCWNLDNYASIPDAWKLYN